MRATHSRPTWSFPRALSRPLAAGRHAIARGQVLARANAATTTELPVSLNTLVQAFKAVPDPMARYKQLLFYATKLGPFPAEERTEDNKVKGCVSQVWVISRVQDGRLYWQADSDSQLTKGLAALLVQGLSGCTPEEIVRVQPDFIAQLGLQQSLTPSRNNGFLNMFKLMQKKALDTYLQQQQQQQKEQQEAAASGAAQASSSNMASSQQQDGDDTPGSAISSSSNGQSATPVADRMRRKLQEGLQPSRLEITDNSDQHAGHAAHRGSAGYSGETHFTVEAVSAAFEGLTSLKRHRLVYSLLDEEMRGPVHALSLITQTPTEAGLA